MPALSETRKTLAKHLLIASVSLFCVTSGVDAQTSVAEEQVAALTSPLPQDGWDGWSRHDDLMRRVRRARVGIGVSSSLIVSGIALSVGGLIALPHEYWADSPDPDWTLSRTLMAMGGLALAAGSVGVTLSAFKLGKAKKDYRRLRRERTTVSISPTGASMRLQF